MPAHCSGLSRSAGKAINAPSPTKNGAVNRNTTALEALVYFSERNSVMNSAANSRPITRPASSVPSCRNIRRPVDERVDQQDERADSGPQAPTG